jgi:hypothetical protein
VRGADTGTCNDQHVQEIGAWIGGFDYDPDTTQLQSNGRLRYTVRTVLHDRNGVDVQHSRHRVSVLGFRKMPPPPAEPERPSRRDALPLS